MTDQHLDPAAIMAAHHGCHTTLGDLCCRCGVADSTTSPCLTHRLAAAADLLITTRAGLEAAREALAAEQAKVQRVKTINIDGLIEYEKEAFRQGNRETEEAVGILMQVRDHLRGALAGEDAAEAACEKCHRVPNYPLPRGGRACWCGEIKPLVEGGAEVTKAWLAGAEARKTDDLRPDSPEDLGDYLDRLTADHRAGSVEVDNPLRREVRPRRGSDEVTG